jgi:hypothetical protein
MAKRTCDSAVQPTVVVMVLPPELWCEVAQHLMSAGGPIDMLAMLRVCRGFRAAVLAYFHTWCQTVQIAQLPTAGVAYDANELAAALRRATYNERLLLTTLSLLCNFELRKLGRAYPTTSWTPRHLLLAAKDRRQVGHAVAKPSDQVGDVFYRRRKKGNESIILPLLSHPRLQVARQGSDKHALKKAERHCRRKIKDRVQRAIYLAYLRTPMSTVAKRALCYSVRQPKLERAGPRDRLKDVVLDGEHLFSALPLHPNNLKTKLDSRLKFYLRRSPESPELKLRGVRGFKCGDRHEAMVACLQEIAALTDTDLGYWPTSPVFSDVSSDTD